MPRVLASAPCASCGVLLFPNPALAEICRVDDVPVTWRAWPDLSKVVPKEVADMTTRYGERMRELRKKRAWPQEQLAEVAGISVRTIQRIENGDPASFETLKAVANALDLAVEELLTPAPESSSKPSGVGSPPVTFLTRVRTGKDLFAYIGGAGAHIFDEGPLEHPEDVELVAALYQDLHDYGDIWNDLEPADHVRVPYSFNERIHEIEERGLWIFAGTQKRTFSAGKAHLPVNLVLVCILSDSNPAIIRLENDDAVVPARTDPKLTLS